MFRGILIAASASFLMLLSGSLAVLSAESAGRALIHEKVDERNLITLAGNTRPEAVPANDLGAVSDSLPINHIMLQLKRSAEQEQAVDRMIAALHDTASPGFHHWLTASEFGQAWGLDESDVRTITTWLQSHGFTVNTVYPNRMVIDFSGTAGMVREALHTSIHNLSVNGVKHIANMSDPQIPVALAPAVAGAVSLHDFRPHNMARPKVRPAARIDSPEYTGTSGGSPYQAVVPADLATIYDFNPLFTAGITGAGQTIAVIEDSNLYRNSDWTNFRTAFGLSQYSTASLTTVHPEPTTGTNNCASPGINSDDSEAIIDAEWASAAAPGAAIVVASCADTGVTVGVFIATQNVVNENNATPIVSISYGICEAMNGAAANASFNSVYQQAAAEGVSVFVAAGDEGAASCDANASAAVHGIGISGFTGTQYNVAVGGTDFGDTLNGTNNVYWSQTNSSTWGSALSYIPEIPWNGSCASSLLAGYMGFQTGYGANGFCDSVVNTSQQSNYFSVAAGSGGPSNCFSGVPATFGVSNGTCAGYAKPSWQTGVAGIPSDGVRDIPDVSMFASNNIWGHYSVVCFSDRLNGGTSCSGNPGNWAGFGGTSVATPVMAGIQALVNQKMGGAQGNPNPVYYQLAATTPGVFHPITQGDIDVNCNGPVNCFGFVGNLDYGRNGRVFNTTIGGNLSVSDSSFASAYAAGTTWNFANGLGSVDANNLVNNWPKPAK